MSWCVYIILCSDHTLYTGISNNVIKRFNDHLTQKGAKYFRSRQPKQLVYLEKVDCRSLASKREAAIKKLARPAKLQLISSASNKIDEFLKQP
ncbi:MAG: GIY-YIG nuclease family protein [Methylococcaceae bacterium]|jgi:putative endonuclease